MQRQSKTMKYNFWKGLLIGVLILILVALAVILFFPNTKPFEETKYFYVRNGYTMADVDRELVKQRIIKRRSLYNTAKSIMGFDEDDIHPGRYLIKSSTSNYSIIHRISNQMETPVHIDLKPVKTPPQFVEIFYENMQSRPMEVQRYVFDRSNLDRWKCDSVSLLAAFFREDYFTEWSKDFRLVIDAMHERYLDFWDTKRKDKLAKLGLSESEIMALAAIVQAEIIHDEEAGTVAQVYINRLHKGMKLQADPTVIYATGEFDTKRVTENDLKVNSPFNTYMYKGLPPAPIRTVRKEIVDDILDSKPNDYLFFCASPKKKGYHNFAVTWEEHKKNAEAYHAYLDEKGIH